MNRRALITLLGGAAAWPLAARAQQSVPVVAFINAGSPDTSGFRTAAFQKGLSESGYVEGQNVRVEYHWFRGQYDRLPALMADIVSRRVTVIATPGGTLTAMAAKAATTTIPIVFGVAEDPVKLGLVSTLARPGGNVLNSRRELIVAATAKQRLPTIYSVSEFTRSGGLIAYGIERTDLFRRAATYVDRILTGTKPADLPVQQPTKFELTINLKTAKTLSLEVPPTLLARADEVIE